MKAAPTARVGALGDEPRRARLAIRGAVQGVGFRPFIYRLATELGLAGWVNNSPQGVFVEVEGARACVEEFVTRIEAEKPPRSFVQSLETSWLDAAGYTGFEIRPSSASGAKTALVLPDIATCGDCLREIFDPRDRRYRYPFTNCTNCGPRFSIIEALPYDRPNTSMKSFVMCEQCRAEYDNPADRRFHAQPNACPVCGPHVELWDALGTHLSTHDAAIADAVQAIRAGGIVAVKGIGGFHLIVDARCEEAVRRLRGLKHREEKPLAVMFPALGARSSSARSRRWRSVCFARPRRRLFSCDGGGQKSRTQSRRTTRTRRDAALHAAAPSAALRAWISRRGHKRQSR